MLCSYLKPPHTGTFQVQYFHFTLWMKAWKFASESLQARKSCPSSCQRHHSVHNENLPFWSISLGPAGWENSVQQPGHQCKQSCQKGTDGSMTSLQTAPQTVTPEFYLSHWLLKNGCFQWVFRLIDTKKCHLYMVSSFYACSLDVDSIAWLVAVSSEVDWFLQKAICTKP